MAPIFTLQATLTVLLVISSLSLSNASIIQKRDLLVPTTTLPGSWVSKGCYVDVGRTLTQDGYADNANMTDESCIGYCSKAGYIYAGTEFSSQCYCGNSLASGSGPAPAADCSMACAGNATEACGGPNRLNLFWSGTTGPQTNPGPGLWKFSGCYNEGTTGRALTVAMATPGGSTNLSVALCTSACYAAGFPLAGVEYAQECYCDNAVNNGAVLNSNGAAGCNMLCNGNYSEFCGGYGTLDIYDFNNAVSLPPYSTSSTSSTSTSTKASTSTSTSKITSSTSSSPTSSSKTSTPSSTSKVSISTSSSKASTSTFTSKTGTSTSTAKASTSSSTSKASSTSSSKASLSTSKSSTSTSTGTSKTSTSLSTSKTSTSSSSSTKVSSSSTSQSSSAPSGSSSSVSRTSSGSSTSGGTTSSTSSSATTVQTLGIKTKIGPYVYQGCYTEATNVRALSSAAFYNYTAMTLETCAADCTGFKYFGVEYGGECYCGDSIGPGSAPTPQQSDCNFLCPGNNYEYCGAGNLLEMYLLNGTAPATTTSSQASSTGTASASASTSAAPIPKSLPLGWSSYGCWIDGTNGRILNNQLPDNNALTVESCVNSCANSGYTIAGMEFGKQCFCDKAIYNGGATTASTDCSMPCSGNSTEFCGSGNRMSLYSKGKPQAYQAPAAQKTGLPTGWSYMGCLQDNIPSNEDPNEIVSTFPYMVWNNNSIGVNTPSNCIAQCQKFGFNAAGLEYGSECFCGDVQNIQVASAPSASTDPTQPQYYTRSAVPKIVADSQCNALCTGNSSYMCGAPNLLTYYAWNATTPLVNWSFPTGSGAGQYSLLIGGVVVPLMTAQNINGKVTFVEKSAGTGEPNGTGSYELDVSLAPNINSAWRAMKGLQTDVFCSAGVILPDKGGRQLSVAGWAGNSNFGVRLYLPDGSPGNASVDNWVEAPGQLSLQVPRWYPSALIMANGSVLIVGGEIGSNAAEQPTLEVLPATGVPDSTTTSGYSNTTVYLDFLQRTAPFNLYPFICVVPSGIFVAYYNEARILDENTFQTVKQLPNMPGAVNDPTGGRNYQLSGSMVLLPQYPPYNAADFTVLICGGSTSNGGYAIDNCISTQPEAAAPSWTIERMPSRRVMPCMAGLPDGTYLILNGGQHGVAGFGLGGDPNLNAVLYDPTKPANSRMSIMANTTIARLYHSEAIVLLDGSVLVSGSDPSGQYTNQPANEYPEEYRVEVFKPPYLLSGAPRPSFSIQNKDWAYGAQITFSVSGGATAVSLLGSVVSTHGNSMGQRTLFPTVTCAGGSCTVVAPPNAHACPPGWYMMFVLNGPTPSVGQYVRIGGDPAQLGNWPKLPGFTLPGM